jgi:hypothetical protein
VLGAIVVGGIAHDAAAAAGASAPIGLTALSLDGSVVLGWQAVPGATSYAVYRGTAAAPDGTQVASGLTAPTFTDWSVSNGSTYAYAVRAVTGSVQSADSNVAEATPLHREATTGNAVALENSYPGSSAWKLEGNAQPPTGLEGFSTASSINAGESVDVKVNTKSGAPYHVEIYRLGYYGGDQARLVSVLPGLVGVEQPYPQTDYSTGLIDCSNWSVSATIATTSDWPTGVYLLRLARDDNACDNHVLLVVRDDGADADIGYGLPVTTYQAYNDWGGRSLYTFNSSGDNTVAGTPRAVKVSFDRPYNQSLDGATNYLTACDVQNISWLEQQGYSVSYLTSIDLDTGSALDRFRVYLSPCHDEYWSLAMRTAVTAARDAGVSLAFLGANAIYWKIRFESNPYSGAANRVQVCYKTVESGGPDPSGTPTTTWRDPVVGQPENAVIGQMYVGDNGEVFFPLVVSGAQAQNRVWRYTTLTTLEPAETASIGQYLIGWEWDARSSNGFEPAGVTTVAGSPASGELLLDAGHTYNPSGSTTATATTYNVVSGAWVFASGTNQWSRGLGLNMAGVGEPSILIQQATLNVLADMRARPTTPSDGLVLDEQGPPALVMTVPAAAATVQGANAVSAAFDRPLDPATVTPVTFTLSGPDGPVEADVAYDVNTDTATLTPDAPLDAGASYTATLTTGIHAIDGSPLPDALTWSFNLGTGPYSLFPAALAPSVTGASVQDGRSGSGSWSYELGVQIRVSEAQPLTAFRYYRDSAETGSHVGRLWNAQGQLIAQAEFADETGSGWQQQDLVDPVVLDAGSTYVASVNANAFFGLTRSGLADGIVVGPLESIVGNNGVFGLSAGTFPSQSFDSSNYFVDVVVAGPPPTLAVTTTSPAADTVGAGSMTTVTAVFSVALDPTTVTEQTFTLVDANGGPVPASVSYDEASASALLTPSQPLEAGESYTAALTTAIKSTGGADLGAPFAWSFTTTAGASLFSPVDVPALSNLTVEDGRTGNGPFSYELGVKIEVDSAAQLTAIRFFKDTEETGPHVGRVWTADGTALAQVPFTNESGSGWQQQSLANPLALQSATVYVVSVNANATFVDTPAGLGAQIVNLPLRSVADGQNGAFGASAGSFPTGSYNSSNYFVDVLVV